MGASALSPRPSTQRRVMSFEGPFMVRWPLRRWAAPRQRPRHCASEPRLNRAGSGQAGPARAGRHHGAIVCLDRAICVQGSAYVGSASASLVTGSPLPRLRSLRWSSPVAGAPQATEPDLGPSGSAVRFRGWGQWRGKNRTSATASVLGGASGLVPAVCRADAPPPRRPGAGVEGGGGPQPRPGRPRRTGRSARVWSLNRLQF